MKLLREAVEKLQYSVIGGYNPRKEEEILNTDSLDEAIKKQQQALALYSYAYIYDNEIGAEIEEQEIDSYIEWKEEQQNTPAGYLFPELTLTDLEYAKKYNLNVSENPYEYEGTYLTGSLSDIKRYADEYLGYELVDDYLDESLNKSLFEDYEDEEKVVAKYRVPHYYEENDEEWEDTATFTIYKYEDEVGNCWYRYDSDMFGSEEDFNSEDEAYDAILNKLREFESNYRNASFSISPIKLEEDTKLSSDGRMRPTSYKKRENKKPVSLQVYDGLETLGYNVYASDNSYGYEISKRFEKNLQRAKDFLDNINVSYNVKPVRDRFYMTINLPHDEDEVDAYFKRTDRLMMAENFKYKKVLKTK